MIQEKLDTENHHERKLVTGETAEIEMAKGKILVQ